MTHDAPISDRRPLNQETIEWLDNLEDLGEDRGYFEPLGARHSAILTDAGPRLLVTFESIESILSETEDNLPLGFEMVAENGWSNLCLLAHGPSWFRDPHVYGYFDRLVDDGFFEDFDQVVFYGAGMCGYGASAFSVVAPGATVIAVQPQATLDPRVAEWDMRFPSLRRTSFTDRYGFAPDMIEAADRAFILYDPEEELDAMHAALFTRQNVTRLRCRHLGHLIDQHLIAMDILQPLIERAMEGTLRAEDFHQLYRARRSYPPYLRRLLTRVDDDDRLMLAGILCRNVIARMNGPRFRRRLEQVEKQLTALGRALPPPRHIATQDDASGPAAKETA